MFLIRITRSGERFVVAQIVVAVGHAEARLIQRYGVSVGILVVDANIEVERRGGEQFHRAHDSRNIVLRSETCKQRELLADGRETARVDLFLVHERVEEVAELLAFVVQFAVRPRIQPLDDLVHLLLALDAKVLKASCEGAIRRNDRGFEPIAVDICKEVIAGLYASVHRREVDTPRTKLGVRRGVLRVKRNR